MPGFRFSLWHFLIATALVCAACGALVAWSPLVASIAILAFLLLNCLSLTGACAATGNLRVYWIGAAIFGIGYWWVASSYFTRMPDLPQFGSYSYSWASSQSLEHRPELATDRLLQALETTLAHQTLHVGDMVMARWNSGTLYAGKITQVTPQGCIVAWTDGSSPSMVALNDIFPGGTSFRATGHAIFGILIALLGGAVATMAFGAKEEAKVEAVANPAAAAPS